MIGLLTKCLEFWRRRLALALKNLIVSCQYHLWLCKWESAEGMSKKKQKLMIVQLLQFLSYSRKAIWEYIFGSYTQAKIDLLNMSRYQPPLPHSLKFCSKKDMKIKIFCFRFTCLCIITGVFLNNKVKKKTQRNIRLPFCLRTVITSTLGTTLISVGSFQFMSECNVITDNSVYI